jgi:hypothetical protein
MGMALLVAAHTPARAADATNPWPWPWVGLLPAILVAGAAIVFAGLAAVIIRGAFVDPDGEGFSLRSSAGGFGGPGLGWRLSGPFVRVVVGLALGAFAVMLALTPGLLSPPRANGASAPSSAASGAQAASAAGAQERQGAGASTLAPASSASK